MFYNLYTIWQFVLLFLGLAFFTAIGWRRLDWGACLVVFLAPLYLLKINNWPLTALEALILVFILVWLVKKIRGKDYSLGLDKNILLASGLIIIGACWATIWSSDLRVSAGILKSWILEPVAFGLIIWEITKTKKNLKDLLTAIVASGAGVAIISLIYWLAGRLTFDGRLSGFYLSPNHLAMFLAPSFLLALGLWFKEKNKWLKRSLLVISCLLLVVLYLTYSYGAWLAVFLAVIFALFFIQKAKLISPKKLFIVYCLLFIVLAVLFVVQFSSPKMADLLKFDRSSIQSRLMVWRSAGQIIKDHWLVGIGPGLFQQYYLEYQKYFSTPYLEWAVPQPHNLFLAWWLQAGLLGLAGFCWLIIIFFWQAAKSFEKTKQPLLIILAAVMIYFLAHGLVDTPYWKNDLALIFWSVIVLSDKAGRLFY